MHRKIIRWVDTLGINLLVFAISFVWLRYYVKSLAWSLISALAVTLAVYLLFRLATRKHKGKKALKAAQAERAAKDMACLQLMPAQAAMDFLHALFREKYPDLIRRADTLSDSDLTIYPMLRVSPLSRQDVADAAKKALANRTDQLLIVAGECDPEAAGFAESLTPLKVEIADREELFRFMEKHGKHPVGRVEVVKRKTKFAEVVRYAFQRKRAKGYALTGLLLLATSFLTFFKIYYLISGSVLLLLALFCLVNNRFNVPTDSHKLLE